MIYIDNNTTGFTIPRITNGIGDKVILINQITKRRFELSTDVLNDVGYKVDITDLKLEIGQYDYVVKKNNTPLESGILQVGGYKSQNNQYEVDFNIIQYEPNIVYTPTPERILDITSNGIYNVESFDKVDVDVIDDDSREIIEGLEKDIVAKNFKISELQTKLNDAESENEQLEEEVSGLQSQIDSVTTLSVTENGTYIPEEGTLGWNSVEVNVEGGGTSEKVDVGALGIKFSNSTFTSVPADLFDFSNVKDWGKMFADCVQMIELGFDFNASTYTFSANPIFTNCVKLVTLNMIGNLNHTIVLDDLGFMNPLSYNSIKSILQAASRKNRPLYPMLPSAGQTPTTLSFSRTLVDQNGELAALIAECNAKNWTITGLTLN